MKKLIPTLLILTTSVMYGQQNMEQVDDLIEQRKYNTAFTILENRDPNNQNPELVIKKVDVALNYFVKSISHQMFAFKDLEKDEDLFELRANGNDQSFSLYVFAINEVLDSLIIQYPDKFELSNALGKFYYEVHLKYGGNWLVGEQETLDRMFQNYKVAAENGAADYLTHYCIGYYHTLKENYGKAIPSFLRSIELDSTYPTSYYNLSICYLYTDQPKKGVHYAVKSIDLYDDTSYKADAARVAAAIYKQIDDADNALKYYQLSDQIQPGNYYTLNQMLEFLLELGNLKESQETASRFFELGPKNPRICSDLVEIYSITKHEQELLEFFNLKIKEYKHDKEVLGNIYFHLGQFYLSTDNEEKAKGYFRLAKENFELVLEKDHYVFKVLEQVLNQ